MNCRHCGAELTIQDLFCYKCGVKNPEAQPISVVDPMSQLLPDEQQEASRLFQLGLACAQNNDLAGAISYYTQAADYNHPGAKNNLGNIYKNGRGIARDFGKAFDLYLNAAMHGDVFAMRNLAQCCLDGTGTEKNFEAAVLWLITAVDLCKDGRACFMLANAYSRWEHHDEERCIFWHKKAAEYGNADSMFWLGDFYTRDFTRKDPIQAERYYSQAGTYGTSELALKAAQKLDVHDSSTPAFNLDKARELYVKAAGAKDETVRLEAAKGLDEKYSYEGEKLRGALDIQKAFSIYIDLANSGNANAKVSVGYFFETGRVVAKDLNMASWWYEEAKNWEGRTRADWCKKKLTGRMEDDAFESHKAFQMTEREENTHSHGKEYYYPDINLTKDAYGGRVYYMNSSYLCSSELDGSDIKVISQEEDFMYAYLHVNETGIYLYKFYYGDGSDGINVKRLEFNGETICQASATGRIDNIYIYDDQVYYVQTFTKDGYIVKAEIKCLNLSSGECTCIYSKARQIDALYATKTKLIFKANYYEESADEEDDGWMVLDLASGATECLSCDECSPENIVDDPDVYNEDSPRYIDNKKKRNIVFFDFDREIFWTKREAYEGKDSAHLECVYYWEPKSLWGDRDKVVSDMPVWKMKGSSHSGSGRAYFDGVHYYHADSYWTFYAADHLGNTYRWGETSHGDCEKFTVMASYLFLNLEAYYEEQYKPSLAQTKPVRKCWFTNELPEELIHPQNCLEEEEPAEQSLLIEASDASQAVEAQTETDGFVALDQNDFAAFKPPIILNYDGLFPFNTEEREQALTQEMEPIQGTLSASLTQEDWDQFKTEMEALAGDFAEDFELVYERMASETKVSPCAEPNTHRASIRMPVVHEFETKEQGRERTNCNLAVAKNIGETDIKYNICTLGAKFHIGFGVPITLVLDGKTYACKTHNSVKGRIDGLKKMYTENIVVVGDMFKAVYSEENNTVTLTRI